MHQLAVDHGNKIPLEYKVSSRTDTTFLSHVSQRTSIAIKKAGSKEIRRAIRSKAPPPKRGYSLTDLACAKPHRGAA